MNARARNTLQQVRLLHKVGLGSRKRTRVPAQRWPKSIEVEYARALIARMNLARGALASLLVALPSLLESARAARRVDSYDADETRSLDEIMRAVRARLEQALDPGNLKELAAQFAQRTQSAQRIALGKQTKAALGADVFSADKRIPAIRDHFISENVSLIKSIPGDVISEVEGIVNRAFTDATPHDVVAKQIEDRFGVGESRARLIARDQIGKLYGQTNAYRQQDLGIESFIWRTSGDERVREEHAALEGQEFRYDDPPDEGLPGEPIQCRCSAEPVFGDLLKAPDEEPQVEPEQEVPVPEPARSSFFPDIGATERAVVGTEQAHQQQMQRAQQHAATRRAEADQLAREREQAEAAHRQAEFEAQAAQRAVDELIAQQEKEQHPLGTLPAVQVTTQPIPEATSAVVPLVQRPVVPQEIVIQHEVHPEGTTPAVEAIKQERPIVPSWYEKNEYNGQTYYRNTLTGKNYSEKSIKSGDVSVWPTDRPEELTSKPSFLKRVLRKLIGGQQGMRQDSELTDDEWSALLVDNPQLGDAAEELARYLF